VATIPFDLNHRPRELRRRVMLPARMRVGPRWRDACILNISSRGLMIRAGSGITEGSVVEIRRGDHTIFARVMWKEGPRAGLHTDEQLPVDDILTLAHASALQVTAADSLTMERRRKKRPIYEDSRQRARLIQFLGTVGISIGLSAVLFSAVRHVLAVPVAAIGAALGG
jgi:hypothetical protein